MVAAHHKQENLALGKSGVTLVAIEAEVTRVNDRIGLRPFDQIVDDAEVAVGVADQK